MLDLDPPSDVSRPARLAVRRLVLTAFRNYASLAFTFMDGAVVLTGTNGAGKTNLLEALSLLAPGRGLRRASPDMLANDRGSGGWVVFAEVEGRRGRVEIGTGIEASAGSETAGRLVRIDRTPAKSSAALGEHVAMLWLTPDLDGLFRGSAGERRRFLDRLALVLDPAHGARVGALERLHRDRNRLLDAPRPDNAWLDAIEHELAETAIAAATMRRATVERLDATIAASADPSSPFPRAELVLEGEVEGWLAEQSAASVEDRYRVMLKELRARDRAAGRGTFGPHLSDLVVVHGPKGMPAMRASTGEQKALLIGLILAQARLVAEAVGCRPILLLDEIAAHLDEIRRAALFEELDRLGCQVFMTGTDPAMFGALRGRAQFLEIAEGHVTEAGR